MLKSKMLTTRCTQGTLKLFKKKLLWKNVSVSATLDQVAQVYYDIYRRYCEERSDSRIGCGGYYLLDAVCSVWLGISMLQRW